MKLNEVLITEEGMVGPFGSFLLSLSYAIETLKDLFTDGEGPAWWTKEYKQNQDWYMKKGRYGPYEPGPKPGGLKNPKWAIIWWMAFYIQNEQDGKETPPNILKAAKNVYNFLGNKVDYRKNKEEVIKAMFELYLDKKEFVPHLKVPERDKKKKWYHKLGEKQLEEGYTLKKISMTKWNHDDSHELDSVEDEDDYSWESEPPRVAKSSHKVYSILDTKTNKEVGKAELDSNDVHGDYGSLQGTFLGKKFSIQVAQRNSDPQKLFNKFVKWPSTKKKWGKLLESDN